MKVLYIALDPPLDPGKVATGNQVRVQGIREMLEKGGNEVVLLAPLPDDAGVGNAGDFRGFYRTREDLEEIIEDNNFDAILAGYWSLLAHLPETAIPVVLDFIAPRLLEILFQAPESLPERTADLITLLPRADHFLVGNQRQSDLLLPLLLQAGFDCRQRVPVSIVPIAVSGKVRAAEKSGSPLKVVSAGVDWPWRNSERYRSVLQTFAHSSSGRFEFIELKGPYPGSEEDAEKESTLLGYREMQEMLMQCHIGIELGERNTEREFSHSFRVAEYLECGLPVIINAWIPLASLIREYDAGWIIEEPAELAPLLPGLLENPALVDEKGKGAARLARDRLNYEVCCKPLLEYLQAPSKALRFAPAPPAAGSEEVPALPAQGEVFDTEPVQRPSMLKIILGAAFKKLLCPKRPESTPDVLMVTRADLFPVDHGAAVKIIKTAEALSRQDRDVWLTTDSRQEYYQFSGGDMITHRFPLYLRFLCLPKAIVFMRLLRKGYPLNNGFLYLPVTDVSYIVRAVWLASRKPVGAYQAEFPAYVRPLRYARSLFGGRILLVQHNVEYERIKNQVKDLTEENFHTLKNIETAMCLLADNIVAVSENDKLKMIGDGIAEDKIHVIPHGVDLHAFRDTVPVNIRAGYGLPADDKVLVYHGTYSYPPNLEAMEVMAREILPRLIRRGLAVSVLAIGSKPPDFPLHENIHFAGSVENLAEVLPAADLAVVPLQEGGGTRMKILDYFAAGIPVISTAKGIEGIPVQHGREALIIDDYEGICDAIEQLLNDPEEAGRLVENANRFVERLGWDAIARRYLLLLQ